MRKNMIIFLTLLAMTAAVAADDFGSKGSMKKETFTLEEMLRYAIEDEHTALAEYEAIMEEFNTTRPYSNIAESEKVHISYLEELYDTYNLEIPMVNTLSHIAIPGTLLDAAQIGVQAEIDNIAMYEKFLKEDLPEDVRDVFEALVRGSENHLSAFERQVSQNGSSGGKGNGRNRS